MGLTEEIILARARRIRVAESPDRCHEVAGRAPRAPAASASAADVELRESPGAPSPRQAVRSSKNSCLQTPRWFSSCTLLAGSWLGQSGKGSSSTCGDCKDTERAASPNRGPAIKPESMKFRHASAYVLVGWYLMVPPLMPDGKSIPPLRWRAGALKGILIRARSVNSYATQCAGVPCSRDAARTHRWKSRLRRIIRSCVSLRTIRASRSPRNDSVREK